MTSSFDTTSLTGAFAQATQADKQALTDALVHESALSAIFNQPPLLVGGCSIYQIDEAWHLAEAKQRTDFVVIESRAALERFLATQTDEAAIVTKACGVSLNDLEALLRQSAYSKIVLWDNSAAA